ncbi:DUF2087 domain-containing protein [Cryobacterium sp.]
MPSSRSNDWRRRYLVDGQLLERTPSGTAYRRRDAPPSAPAEVI